MNQPTVENTLVTTYYSCQGSTSLGLLVLRLHWFRAGLTIGVQLAVADERVRPVVVIGSTRRECVTVVRIPSSC